MRRSSDAMSTCRIERKRAHDREAQRASRAKTKAYIAHLEKTVADLSESSGDNRANYLAQHASHQAQEIDKLQGLVGKIRSLVQEAGKSEQSSSPEKTQALKLESTAESTAESSSSFPDPISATNWDSPSEDQWIPEIPKPVESGPKKARTKVASASRNLIVLGISMLCEETDDTSYFQRVNAAISKVEQTPDNLSTIEEDMDILSRAIVHGWDAAERVHHFDIVWRFLRAFDEGLWYRAAPIERFAHFWGMRCHLLYKIQPKNQERRQTAAFMQQTMKQQSAMPHPPVIDYFGWPQVRNHLLKEGINKCAGKASIAFAESFRFDWQYELRDMYKVNRQTGLYCLSEGFLHSWNDIDSYQMLTHELIPYYAHPVTALQTPVAADIDDDDSSIDGDIGTQTGVIEEIAAQTQHLMNQVSHTEDWMSHYGMDLTQDGNQFDIDSFSLPHDNHLTHWPTI
ncbi:hypothetical protein HII31_01860 [Pseudocercospora fuligena]|uniref:BZIP domain-containing protein n=1 Tax=Pseudocercospora fuligena TaxID=685502 RepID=A0A8H6RU59_9PEZI|nr:hypothetical protein HII31_01860 [Pseudocercospora fuligena]